MSRGYWYADDATLLALYEQLGNIAAVARVIGYVDPNWVRRRLRRLGVPPGKPGRPKKETRKVPDLKRDHKMATPGQVKFLRFLLLEADSEVNEERLAGLTRREASEEICRLLEEVS